MRAFSETHWLLVLGAGLVLGADAMPARALLALEIPTSDTNSTNTVTATDPPSSASGFAVTVRSAPPLTLHPAPRSIHPFP